MLLYLASYVWSQDHVQKQSLSIADCMPALFISRNVTVDRPIKPIRDLFRGIYHLESTKILFVYAALRENCPTQPFDDRLSELRSRQHNGESRQFSCLNQRKSFKQFVEGAKAAGENQEPACVPGKHHLANKEVAASAECGAIRVHELFVRQFNIQSNRRVAGITCSAVTAFHNSMATTCDDRESVFTDKLACPLSQLICRIAFRQTSAAENPVTFRLAPGNASFN
jgi:hypothetical protein